MTTEKMERFIRCTLFSVYHLSNVAHGWGRGLAVYRRGLTCLRTVGCYARKRATQATTLLKCDGLSCIHRHCRSMALRSPDKALTLEGPQSRFGHKLLIIGAVCPPERGCSPTGVGLCSAALLVWAQKT